MFHKICFGMLLVTSSSARIFYSSPVLDWSNLDHFYEWIDSKAKINIPINGFRSLL